jgi:hypothetical protein
MITIVSLIRILLKISIIRNVWTLTVLGALDYFHEDGSTAEVMPAASNSM